MNLAWSLPNVSEIRRRWAGTQAFVIDVSDVSSRLGECISDLLQGDAVRARTCHQCQVGEAGDPVLQMSRISELQD